MPPGAEAALDLSDEEPGTYTFVCDIPGHEATGTVGELTLG